MNLQALFPVFIPYNSGNSTPMTDEGVKVLLGMLIILHIIYGLSCLYELYIISKYKYSIKKFDWLSLDNFIQFMSGTLVLLIDGSLLLIYLGSLIAKFL